MNLLLVLVYAMGVAACSNADLDNLRGLAGKKKKVNDGDAEDGDLADDPEKGKYTRSIDNSGASFQVKDVELLRSSMNSCMGPGMLTVREDMLLPLDPATPPPEVPDNRFRFLLAAMYKAGDDVIEKERGNMVDAAAGARTGIAADGLTDTYLRSLEMVSNVVAHNCEPDKQECKCETKDLAREMLTRCLPGLDPETVEMEEAAEMLSLVCAPETGTAGMRKAIASMLSSYAFASAR